MELLLLLIVTLAVTLVVSGLVALFFYKPIQVERSASRSTRVRVDS